MEVAEGKAPGEDVGGLYGSEDVSCCISRTTEVRGTRQGLTLSSLVGERMRMPWGSMVIWRRFQSWYCLSAGGMLGYDKCREMGWRCVK